MELFETNEELEALMPSFAKKEGERWIREDEVIIDDDKQESGYDSDSDYDNEIEFDPSEFEELSTEELSPEEKEKLKRFSPVDFYIYEKNKAYRAAQSGSFTEDIVRKESGGNYRAVNPNSSAAGKYQFLWGTWGDDITRFTGVKSKQDFLNNPKAQDDFYNNYYLPNKLMPSVRRLVNKGFKKDTDTLAKLVHFRGEKGAEDYLLGKVKDKPESYNSSISSYIKQTGGDFEDLPVYQTSGSMINPFNQYDTNGQSLYSGNASGAYPLTFNKGHIGYSPASLPTKPGVPAAYYPMDAAKAWSDKTQIPYTPDNTQNTTLNTSGKGAFDGAMDMAGLANPIIGAVKKGAEIIDAAGEKQWNFYNNMFNATKDIKNLAANTSAQGLAGATAIFSNLENDRLQRKSLKNMYRESIRDYYKTSFGFK